MAKGLTCGLVVQLAGFRSETTRQQVLKSIQTAINVSFRNCSFTLCSFVLSPSWSNQNDKLNVNMNWSTVGFYAGNLFGLLIFGVLIISSVLDIIFLHTRRPPEFVSMVRVQILRILLTAGYMISNTTMLVAAHRKSHKLLVSSSLVGAGLCLSMKIVYMTNILIRVSDEENMSPLLHLETRPLMMMFGAYVASSMFVRRSMWFLKYCWSHKIGGIGTSEKCGGIDLKLLLMLQIPLVLLMYSYLSWHGALILLSSEIRTKVVRKDPWYLLTTFVWLGLIIQALFTYVHDAVMGLRLGCCKRLRRYLTLSLIPGCMFHPVNCLQIVQETHIFESGITTLLLKQLASAAIILYVLINPGLVFMYYKYLKHAPASVKFPIIFKQRLQVENAVSIGEGHSATVHRGKLQISSRWNWNQSWTSVAVKVFPPELDPSDQVLKEELANLSRIMHASKHPNLVRFYGVCFLPESDLVAPLGRVNILMELCVRGDLQSLLQRMQDNLRDKGECGQEQQYLSQLNLWAEQVARGMEFLASQKIIHGDLAARNVLLDDALIAKISDFGMSRKLYNYQVYVSTKQTMFPYKWMAPESLDRMEFSSASDVYSYGVLLWEVYSLGETPWEEKIWTSKFLQQLMDGEHLPIPLFASPKMYDSVLCACWKVNPSERPTFAKLVEILDQ